MRGNLQDKLKAIFDLERIVSRIEVTGANARDLVSLRSSLAVLPEIKSLLKVLQKLLQQLCEDVHLHQELFTTLLAAIVDEPPFSCT